MMETSSNLQNKQDRKKSSPQDNLMSKVVLLIGNDAGLLQSLAVECAAHGSDIALASSRLPSDLGEKIRENVQAFGGRFLLLDKSLIQNIQKAEMLITRVKRELGSLDILIDFSAHQQPESEVETGTNGSQPCWWLSQAILQEIKN